MQISIQLPCTAHELECTLHRISHEGHWADCRVYGVYAPQTRKHALVFDYGNSKHESKGEKR